MQSSRYILSAVTMIFASWCTVAMGGTSPELKLSVQSPTAKLAPCEPLWVTIELKNHGKKPIQVQSALSVESGAVAIYTAFNEGDYVGFYRPGVHFSDRTLDDKVAWNYESIENGESVTGGGWILFNMAPLETDPKAREFVFKKPGRYRLKAVYERKGMRVESVPVTIVVEPLPKSEEDAFKLWCRPEIGETVQGKMGPANVYADLKQFVEKYPKSIYAAFAALTLAEHCFNDTDEPDRRDKGLKYLEIAAQASKHPRIQEQVAVLRSSWGPKKSDEEYQEDVIRRVQSGEIYNTTSPKKSTTPKSASHSP